MVTAQGLVNEINVAQIDKELLSGVMQVVGDQTGEHGSETTDMKYLVINLQKTAKQLNEYQTTGHGTEKEVALAKACCLEARLRLYSIMTDKAAVQGFDQANHIARETLMDQNCGMADPAAIIFDSAEIEQVLPRINALL